MSNHISEKRKRDADANFKKKVDLFKDWAEKGIPFQTDAEGRELYANGLPVLYDFPTTLDTLRRWRNDELGIKSTNQATLERNSEQHSKINDLFVKLAAKAEECQLNVSPSKIVKLESRIKQLEHLINGQNNTIEKQESEIDTLQDDLRSAQQEVVASEAVMHKAMDVSDKQIERLKADLARLRTFKVVTNND